MRFPALVPSTATSLDDTRRRRYANNHRLQPADPRTARAELQAQLEQQRRRDATLVVVVGKLLAGEARWDPDGAASNRGEEKEARHGATAIERAAHPNGAAEAAAARAAAATVARDAADEGEHCRGGRHLQREGGGSLLAALFAGEVGRERIVQEAPRRDVWQHRVFQDVVEVEGVV